MRVFAIAFLFIGLSACSEATPPTTANGTDVHKASVDVQVGPNGRTVEQDNIRDRLILDNTPGSLKHLYVISAYSGQVLMYSTVRGKVTSSGKRLNPSTVCATDGQYVDSYSRGFGVRFGNGDTKYTSEVLQDDGSYGSSVEYLYWWDAQGRYHQHYVSGGQILHISDQPIAVRGVVINMELSGPPDSTK